LTHPRSPGRDLDWVQEVQKLRGIAWYSWALWTPHLSRLTMDGQRKSAMFRRRNTLLFATAHLSLLVVVVHGLTFAAHPTQACAGASHTTSQSACDVPSSCCCGTAAPTQPCKCHSQDETPQSPPAGPDNTVRALKWLHSADTATSVFAGALPGRSAPAQMRPTFLPPQRSVQALLCIWQI
jgi:hypothetical protein